MVLFVLFFYVFHVKLSVIICVILMFPLSYEVICVWFMLLTYELCGHVFTITMCYMLLWFRRDGGVVRASRPFCGPASPWLLTGHAWRSECACVTASCATDGLATAPPLVQQVVQMVLFSCSNI